jgi:hypothetical protein
LSAHTIFGYHPRQRYWQNYERAHKALTGHLPSAKNHIRGPDFPSLKGKPGAMVSFLSGP